jgi:hypothetical protein
VPNPISLNPLVRSASSVDLLADQIAKYATNIDEAIQNNESLAFESILSEISELPLTWRNHFLQRGSIYPELRQLIQLGSYAKIVEYCQMAEIHHLSTPLLNILMLGCQLELHVEGAQQALQNLFSYNPIYSNLLDSLIVENSQETENLFETVRKAIR